MSKKNVNNRYREEEKEENKEKKEMNEQEEASTPSTSEEETVLENVDELKEQIKQLKNEVLKSKAEEINFKKRVEEEKNKSVKYANQALLEKFVEQIDLFDKVVSMKTEDPVLKNFLVGFEMINQNFKQILSDEGVKKIEVQIGKVFDPKFHHPLQTEWDENYEENAILAELKGGYLYKDRVLRPTLVKVNKKEGK